MASERKKVVLIPGDGIGPEIAEATTRIIEASGASINWLSALAGSAAIVQGKDVIPSETLDAIAKVGVALKGPIATPVGTGHASANVFLRRHFKLFANVRPVRNLPGVFSRYQNIDLVVVRENTEDVYAGIEHVIVPGVVETIKVITAEASERVARFTFEYCQKHGRKRITAAHKANIMKLSDGLFLESIRKIRKEFNSIEYDEIIIDNLCNQLVLKPEKFDVILTQNLYGDIVSDLTAGLIGGLGVAPAANYGKDCAIFEAVHGSAPDIAGKGVANPCALLLSACLMLEHLNFSKEAARIRQALETVLTGSPEVLTPDLGGKGSTGQFADGIIDVLEKSDQKRLRKVK